MRETHRYVIHYEQADGTPLPSLSIEPDFEPVRSWARFQIIRKGILPPVLPGAPVVVSPRWRVADGAPWLEGLAAEVAGVRSEIPAAYFQPLAASGAAALIERAAIRAGDRYRWSVAAYPCGHDEADITTASGLRVEEVEHALPLLEGQLDPFLACATPLGTSDALDVPTFVADAVIEEAFGMARDAGDVETGGVLLGRLHRQQDPPEVFLEVTAQVPARHAVAGETSFAFTPETWAAARDAIALRAAGEELVGWQHFHPDFCRSCPPERRSSCRFRRPFFSIDDVALHRTCFPGAHQVALLVSDIGSGGLTASFFGWRHGMVSERGVHRLRPGMSPAACVESRRLHA